MNLTQHIANEINKNKTHIPLSGITSYHLLSGSLVLSNSVITAGMATALYTGNGTTQSVATGVDMATQWGNSASETFGGLVWAKNRGAITGNGWFDTVRGGTKSIFSNTTAAEGTDPNGITAFLNDGFTTGTDYSTNTANYASWNFQTTHRTSGVTNHGKAYTCHYNPFTGFTMVKYEGSGLAGHEIPHHLGRKLGFVTTKALALVNNWGASYADDKYLYLNTTAAEATNSTLFDNFTDGSTIIGVDGAVNASANQYIMYGWANSYFDKANTLIGNYEVGVFQGTGVNGSKVATKGKPAWVMIKRLDAAGDWYIFDNKRETGAINHVIFPNLSAAEDINGNINVPASGFGYLDFANDGFICSTHPYGGGTAGGQYLYMAVYDNDAGSGKSKYPRATDTSALSLTATVPFANGVDANGTKNTVLTKNETITGLTLTQGKNYVYAKGDGTYGVSSVAPKYLDSISGVSVGKLKRSDEFNILTNAWTNVTSLFNDNVLNKLGDSSRTALYLLDGNANDVGNTYNGTLTGMTYKNGLYNQCVESIAAGGNIATTQTLTTTHTVIMRVKVSNITGAKGLYVTGSAAGNRELLYISGSTVLMQINGAWATTAIAGLEADKFYIVVLEAPSSTERKVTVYKEDGTFLGTGSGTGAAVGSLANFTIGSNAVNADTPSLGVTFEHISTFNKILTSSELDTILNVYTYAYTTESRNYLDAIVYADAGGQPTYIEQLPKIEYKDVVKANEYQGKNACTAWVNFDGTTTPPTIRDSFNVSAVIRTATGIYDIYFKAPMNNVNYSISAIGLFVATSSPKAILYGGIPTINKFTISYDIANNLTLQNQPNAMIQVFGGKN